MGDLAVETIGKGKNKFQYIEKLLDDITALDLMLKNKVFDTKDLHIGAEQEFCIVDENFRPANQALNLLNALEHDSFTTELALYNLEINAKPKKWGRHAFSNLEKELKQCLDLVENKAEEMELKIILTGILPTINFNHVNISYMTPKVRYNILNESIRKLRKQDFEIHIQGLDELHIRHNSIIYEGCNTSFQAHIQIDPANFRADYNWAQYISGPVLAVSTNSPLLLRRQLWHETRIALFSQSVDSRSLSYLLNDKEPRVGFGGDWQKGNASDYFKDSLSRFKSIVSGHYTEKSTTQLENGEIPKLKALNLHNGTDYRWNRLCYGITNQRPHLRIENRYLPSGPSLTDEIANFCFWAGLMNNRPESANCLYASKPFYQSKINFFNAAQLGMDCQFYWDGELFTARKLICENLLPMAKKGLIEMGIGSKSIDYYLNIIDKRANSHTGSTWMIKNYQALREKHTASVATKMITRALHENNRAKLCVADWPMINQKKYFDRNRFYTVSAYMKTQILTAQPNDSIQLVKRIMEWKNIHHMPVIRNPHELLGIISWSDIEKFEKSNTNLNQSIRAIYNKKIFVIHRHNTMTEAEKIMIKNNIHCLPVVHNNHLIGLITAKDIAKWKQL